jgi:hypothetical protein
VEVGVEDNARVEEEDSDKVDNKDKEDKLVRGQEYKLVEVEVEEGHKSVREHKSVRGPEQWGKDIELEDIYSIQSSIHFLHPNLDLVLVQVLSNLGYPNQVGSIQVDSNQAAEMSRSTILAELCLRVHKLLLGNKGRIFHNIQPSHPSYPIYNHAHSPHKLVQPTM